MAPHRQLPVEIWAHIVSYLTKGDVIKLCRVNRVFYAFAQDIRYKEVSIKCVTRGTIAKLEHIKRSSETAHCTASLTLDIEAFRSLDYFRPRWKKTLDSARKVMRSPKRRKDSQSFSTGTDKSACEVFDILLDAVKRMDNLRNMHVSWDHSRELQPNQSRLWESVSERITSLTVHRLPPWDVNQFSNTYQDLSQLKSLSLSLGSPFALLWGESDCIQVAKLINSVKTTLESLALDTSADNSSGSQFIFANLDRFERLKHMDLRVTATFNGQHVVDFINLRCQSLQELSLTLVRYLGDGTFLNRFDLPHLLKLQLRFNDIEGLMIHRPAFRRSPSTTDLSQGDIVSIAIHYPRSGSRLVLRVRARHEAPADDVIGSILPALRTLNIEVRTPFSFESWNVYPRAQ